MTKIATRALLFAFVTISLAPLAIADNDFDITFTITDNGGGPGVKTLAASLTQIGITGSSDDWNIDLSGLGITLSDTDLPQQWQEAPAESGENVLEMEGAQVLELLSDDTTPPTTPDNFCSNGSPLPNGASHCFIGTDSAGTDFFAVVLEQSADSAAPEPASLLLGGLGLAGLAIAGIRRKRQS